MSQTTAGLLILTFMFVTVGGMGFYACWQKHKHSADKQLKQRHP